MRAKLKAAILTSNCAGSNLIGRGAVGGDGSATDGWLVVGPGRKDLISDAMNDDPWVVWAREQLTAAGYNYKSSANFGTGTSFGWLFAQTLQIAGQLDGGLTRSNFIVAMRSFDMTHPSFYPGIKVNMNGNKDAYLLEGSDVSHWDAQAQRWIVESIVDLSGTTPPCHWDQAASICR
jgi:hypothetical protein